MGWPQAVHVSPVLHAVASCALLTQLVLYIYAKKNKQTNKQQTFPSAPLQKTSSKYKGGREEDFSHQGCNIFLICACHVAFFGVR